MMRRYMPSTVTTLHGDLALIVSGFQLGTGRGDRVERTLQPIDDVPFEFTVFSMLTSTAGSLGPVTLNR